METTTKQEPSVLERLAKFNLSIQCSPPSGGVDEDWPHIAYAVTITRNGKALWTGPYKLGIGHVKIPKSEPKYVRIDLKAKSCAALARKQGVEPSIDGVLYSLLSDGEALESEFKNWCQDYGYSDDSIKALETYQACVKIGQALSKAFTPAELQELREIFQDY